MHLKDTSDAPATDAAKGLLFDYGGTLVREVAVDLRAGNEWLLAQAAYCPPHVGLDEVIARASRVAKDVADVRDRMHIETPWPMLTRVIHDFFGVRFDIPMPELELGFWQAAVTTEPMPGVRDALDQLHRAGLHMAVVSNSSFGEPVIRHELGKHGLTEHLRFVMVSSDYAVRKPNVLLFEVAAARLGCSPQDIWFVGDRLDTDIAGARAAGMRAVWFNPDADASTPPAADLTVTNWDAFVHHALGTVSR